MIHQPFPSVPGHYVVRFFGVPGVIEDDAGIAYADDSHQKAVRAAESMSDMVWHGFVSVRASGSILAGFAGVSVVGFVPAFNRPGFGLGGFFRLPNHDTFCFDAGLCAA